MPSFTAKARSRDKALTIADLYEAGHDLPGELVRGQFISMTPTGQIHATVELNLAFALKSFIQDKHLGRVMTGEVGIITRRSPDSVRGADVAYISYDRLKGASTEGYLDVAPELIAEIVSPNDRWSNINEKLEEYFDLGVFTVWIVDPKERQVYVYQSPTQIQKLGPADVLSIENLLPGLRIPVENLFED